MKTHATGYCSECQGATTLRVSLIQSRFTIVCPKCYNTMSFDAERAIAKEEQRKAAEKAAEELSQAIQDEYKIWFTDITEETEGYPGSYQITDWSGDDIDLDEAQ